MMGFKENHDNRLFNWCLGAYNRILCLGNIQNTSSQRISCGSKHEQAEAITRPYVSVAPFLEPDNPIFYLRISNTGKTSANKLKLTIDKSFHKFGEKSAERDLASFAAFIQGIKFFQPGAAIPKDPYIRKLKDINGAIEKVAINVVKKG